VTAPLTDASPCSTRLPDYVLSWYSQLLADPNQSSYAIPIHGPLSDPPLITAASSATRSTSVPLSPTDIGSTTCYVDPGKNTPQQSWSPLKTARILDLESQRPSRKRPSKWRTFRRPFRKRRSPRLTAGSVERRLTCSQKTSFDRWNAFNTVIQLAGVGATICFGLWAVYHS